MTLKKSFVTLCLLCLVLPGMAQVASAQDILILWSSTGGGTRNQGNVWGVYKNASWDQMLEQAFHNIFPGANITTYDFANDTLGIRDTAVDTSTTEKAAMLNAYDLIFLDSSSGSGDTRNRPNFWNGLTTVLFTTKTFLPQTGRWQWLNTSTITATMDTTPTQFITLPTGQIRVFDRNDRYTIITTNGSGVDNTGANVGTTSTVISQRAYVSDMSNTNAAEYGRFPGIADSVAYAKWTNIGGTFHTSTTQIVGGPRLFVGIEDDRNLLDPAFTDTTVDSKKMADVLMYLSDECIAWLRDQLISLSPSTLAPQARVLVIGAYGADATNGSNVNGGRHFGYVFGDNLDQTYEGPTLDLLEEAFSPNGLVDFYEIDQSDYKQLKSLGTATTGTLAWLNSYDFIWMGHSVPTGNIGSGSADRSTAWNSLTTPMIAAGQFIAGNNSSRWSWIAAGSPGENAGTTPTTVLDVNDTGHYAFSNVDVSGGTLRLYPEAPYTPNNNWYNGTTNTALPNLGQRFAANNLVGNNGNRIAEFQGYTNACHIIVWEGSDIGQPFYTGSPQTCNGPRALLNIMDNRNQIDPTLVSGGLKGYNTLTLLTAEGKQVIKDLMVGMASTPLPVELGSFELQ